MLPPLCLSCSLLRHLFDRSLQLILPCPMGMKKVHTLEILEGRRCLHRLVNQPICPDSITCFGLALLGFLVWVLSISFSGMCLLFCMWVFCFAMSVEPVYLLSVQLLLSLISNASLRPFPFRAHEKMALFHTVFPLLFNLLICPSNKSKNGRAPKG